MPARPMLAWLALPAAVLVAPSASAYRPYVVPGTSIALHWRTHEIGYRLDEVLPPQWDEERVAEVARESFAAWSEIACFPLTFTSEGFLPGAAIVKDDRENWIRWVRDAAQWDQGVDTVALTYVHFTPSGEIIDADIDVNLAGFAFSLAAACDPDADGKDLRATLTHEIGHVVGLDHSAVAGATMVEHSVGSDCGKRTLEADDLAGFCATYEGVVLPPTPDADADADAGADVPLADAGGADAGPSDVGGRADDGCAAAGAGASHVALVLVLLGLLGARRARARVVGRRRSRPRAPLRRRAT